MSSAASASPFIIHLPKAELHLHLEGSIEPATLWRKQNFDPIFEALERGRERGERDFGVSVLWIFDAVRHFGAEAARKVAELAVRYRERNVVGFGIAATSVGPRRSCSATFIAFPRNMGCD